MRRTFLVSLVLLILVMGSYVRAEVAAPTPEASEEASKETSEKH